MSQSYTYSCRLLELEDGPVYVDFDFIPEEPTWEQEMACCVHSCDTCENKCPEIRADGCRYGEPGQTGKNCPLWELGFDDVSSKAQCDAYNRYWLELHRSTMKGKPVPLGRKEIVGDPVPFMCYPEAE